jgi:hypothetical protein
VTRCPRLLLAAALLLGACSGGGNSNTVAPDPTTPGTSSTRPAPATTTTTTATPPPDPLCPFRGVGTWVDVYDTIAAFAEHGRVSPVTVDAIAQMRDDGIHTLYLQVAKDDTRSPGVFVDRDLAASFLTTAHAAGLDVVAWYLPTLRDPALDRERAVALAQFEARGEHFDGVALDIEDTSTVDDVSTRNRLLVDLVRALDDAAGDMPVGAIVYPPVALDVINPALWPDFPWRDIGAHVDVWLPMAYSTFRDDTSPYHDPARYARENVQRLREHLGSANAPVHVIGGIADEFAARDVEKFVSAANESGAIGVSLYDFATQDPSTWASMRAPTSC